MAGANWPRLTCADSQQAGERFTTGASRQADGRGNVTPHERARITHSTAPPPIRKPDTAGDCLPVVFYL